MANHIPWAVRGIIGVYPALRAVHVGHVQGATFTDQLVLTAIVLGGYLMIASHQPR